VADKRPDSDEPFEETRRTLYRERPEDFVAARDRLVRELRARKDRDLAARVARLRRPPLSLWLANRLHDVAGPQLRDLLSAGGELQAAQASAAGGDASARRRFRELIGRHSQLIDGLVRAGLALSEEQGHGSGEEVGRRLAATLRAASTEPGESGRALLEGRLDTEMEPGGFSLVSTPGTGTGSGTPSPIATPRTDGGEEEERESALEVAARAAEARRAAVESERAAMVARSRAEELSHRADALAREARKARQEADAADEKARSAEEAAAEAQQVARELERPRRT
jgi:hypothetical protein